MATDDNRIMQSLKYDNLERGVWFRKSTTEHGRLLEGLRLHELQYWRERVRTMRIFCLADQYQDLHSVGLSVDRNDGIPAISGCCWGRSVQQRLQWWMVYGMDFPGFCWPKSLLRQTKWFWLQAKFETWHWCSASASGNWEPLKDTNCHEFHRAM